MMPVRVGLIFLSQKIFWRIVEEWKTIFKNLEARGLADNRSRWVIVVDEKGETVIFNEHVTAEVFNPKFFSEVNKSNENWTKVVRLPLESDWEEYVPSFGPNGRNTFKQFGWRMNGSVFTPRADEEDTDNDCAGPGLTAPVKRRVMD